MSDSAGLSMAIASKSAVHVTARGRSLVRRGRETRNSEIDHEQSQGNRDRVLSRVSLVPYSKETTDQVVAEHACQQDKHEARSSGQQEGEVYEPGRDLGSDHLENAVAVTPAASMSHQDSSSADTREAVGRSEETADDNKVGGEAVGEAVEAGRW